MITMRFEAPTGCGLLQRALFPALMHDRNKHGRPYNIVIPVNAMRANFQGTDIPDSNVITVQTLLQRVEPAETQHHMLVLIDIPPHLEDRIVAAFHHCEIWVATHSC